MPPDQILDPLQRFPVFETSDADEFRTAILTRFGGTNFKVATPHAFKARGSLVDLQSISLVHGACNSDVSVDYPEMDRFRLLIALAGQGEATVGNYTTSINQHQSCILTAEQAVQIRGEGRHGWLTLRIAANALEQRLTSILGFKPKGRLEFEAPAINESPRFQVLRRLVSFLAEQMASEAAMLPTEVLRTMEQAIVTAFLYSNRHTFSDLIEQDQQGVAPYVVRLAEDYIVANWDRHLNVEELVALTNVSSRSLFRSFKQARGLSPMAFARVVRLRHARDLLKAADAETTVTGVAFKCGFGNLGHFAKDYRRHFGENPSDTLARSDKNKSKNCGPSEKP